jgi:SAM-dependent methyltransferase
MSFKSDWVSNNVRCVACGSIGFSAGNWTCPACGDERPTVSGVPSFITEELALDYRIVDTDNVSAHPYAPSIIEILDKVAEAGGMALDCGAGSRDYRSDHLIQTEIKPYGNVDLMAVNQQLPFVDDAFDAILSLDVLEHVTDPFAAARELARVLRPGGILFINLPFLQVEHGYPHHYFNATRMGLRQLFDGLLDPIVHAVPAGGHAATTMMMMIRVYRGGLPKPMRAEFDKMTVGELAEIDWGEFRESKFGKVSEEVMWKMASTTQAVFSKPGEQRVDLDPTQLATFSKNVHKIG